MGILSATCIHWVYPLFGVQTDHDLITKMSTVGLIYVIGTLLFLIFQPAPYGRYSKSVFGPTINAKLGWMVHLTNY